MGMIDRPFNSIDRSSRDVYLFKLFLNQYSKFRTVSSFSSKRSGLVAREETASAYLESIEGDFTGKTLRVWNAPD